MLECQSVLLTSNNSDSFFLYNQITPSWVLWVLMVGLCLKTVKKSLYCNILKMCGGIEQVIMHCYEGCWFLQLERIDFCFVLFYSMLGEDQFEKKSNKWQSCLKK